MCSIRSALVWVGEPDPCEGRREIEATSNPEYEDLAALLHAWYACYDTKAATLHRVVQDIGLYAEHAQGKPGNDWNDLQDALRALDERSEGKTLNTRAIGKRFRTMAGRVIEGKRLARAGTYKRALEWQIQLTPAG